MKPIKASRIAIIPLAINGAFELYDKPSKKLTLGQTISLTIGQPIDAKTYAKHDKDSLLEDAYNAMQALLKP